MADSLLDILSRKDFSEPSEMTAIKQFVRDHYNAEAEVIIHDKEIIITVASAALAGTLRYKVRDLQATAKTEKRLVFRIR